MVPSIKLVIAMVTTEVVVQSTDVIAAQQIKAEEQQRIRGIIPNFYTSYIWNAAPLSAKQKFSLSAHNAFDPVVFIGVNRVYWQLDERVQEAPSFQKGMTLAQNFIGRLALRARTSLVNKRAGIRLQGGVTMFDEKKPPASAGTPDGRPRIDREPLLDSHQAAAMLKVHPRTLQRLVHRGEIAAVHVGKLWRFKPSTLTAWIDRDIAS